MNVFVYKVLQLQFLLDAYLNWKYDFIIIIVDPATNVKILISSVSFKVSVKLATIGNIFIVIEHQIAMPYLLSYNVANYNR